MNKIIYIVIYFFITALSAQEYSKTKIDSLIKVADNLSKIDDVQDFEHSLELSKKAFKESEKINYKNGMTQSIISIVADCYNLGKNEDVIKYSQLAKKLIDETEYSLYAENLRIRGMSYTNLGFTKEARNEFRRAAIIAAKIKDIDIKEFSLSNIHTSLSLSYEDESDKDKTAVDSLMYYSKKAYQELLKLNPKFDNKESYLALAAVNLGAYSLHFKKDLDSTERYLNKALLLAQKNDFVFVNCLANHNMGKLLVHKKQFEKAIAFFLEGIAISKKVNNPYLTKDLFFDISTCYDSLNNAAKSKEYLTKYVYINDSITAAEKTAMKLPMEHLINENEQKLSESKTRFTLIIILASIALIGLTYLSYTYFRKFKKEKISNEEKEILLAEKKNEIEKNKESNDERLNEILKFAINDDPLFYIRFQEFYPEFCDILKEKAPNLVLSELKCSALLKLNFTTKEIARFTNSTVRAVEQKKYRIRKKLNIPGEDDINIWMMNVGKKSV